MKNRVEFDLDYICNWSLCLVGYQDRLADDIARVYGGECVLKMINHGKEAVSSDEWLVIGLLTW